MIERCLKNILLVIALLTGTVNTHAQAKGYGIPDTEYFSRRQYNAASQNWDITQSNKDILYFANNDGILEYDGARWNLYRDMGPYVVRSVKSVGERIYAGTYSEFGYFRFENNHGLKFTPLEVYGELKSGGDIWDIHEWNEKIVLRTELALYILKNDSLLKRVPAVSRFTNSFLVNGLMLVNDEMDGLLELRGEEVYPVAGSALLKDKVITSIMSVSNDTIIIGTLKDGLFIWDMQRVERWNVPANPVLKEANIYCSVSYENTYLVYGSIQSGIIIVDRSGNIVYQVGKDKGLNNNTVLSLFVDKDGNLWGGLDNGIARINLRSSISFLQGYYDLGTGYAAAYRRRLWYFGTNQALFAISEEDFSNPLKTRDDFRKIPGTDGQVWSLYETDNTLLCGHNLGALEITGNRAEVITPPNVNGVWVFRRVPGKENLLIAGTYNGLILFEKNDRRWKYKSTIEGFNESSRYIEWARDGDLWISHGYKGLYSLEFDDNYSQVTRVQLYSHEDYPEFGSAPVITKIDDNLVVATSFGLHQIIKADSVVSYHELDEYFADNYPERILQDRFRNIWFFSSDRTGVLRLMEDGTYKKVDFPFIPLENKLVPSFESIYVINSSNILFGVEDGFAHYSVREGMDYSRQFKVHIRSFMGQADSVSYVLNQNNGNVVPNQEYIPEYRFRDNSFEVKYAATYFREGQLEYSTFLSNYDIEATSWSPITNRQFAKLKEGSYEFMVKARNSYGIQSDPLVFRFRVLPPWYRTNVAKTFYLLIFVLLISGVVFVFNRRIEANRKKEELRQQEAYRVKEKQYQTEALEVEKELIRIRNERLRSEMIFKEKELANSTMNILQKNKSLINIKGDLDRIAGLNDGHEIKNNLKRLMRKIERDIDSEDYWQVFEVHLEQVHEAFLKRLSEKHPDLTNRERNLCAYIRMGMSSKEIAALINISFRAVENNRYRLRQKLNLQQGENLSEYISAL